MSIETELFNFTVVVLALKFFDQKVAPKPGRGGEICFLFRRWSLERGKSIDAEMSNSGERA